MAQTQRLTGVTGSRATKSRLYVCIIHNDEEGKRFAVAVRYRYFEEVIVSPNVTCRSTKGTFRYQSVCPLRTVIL